MKNIVAKGIMVGCIASVLIACNSSKDQSSASPVDKDGYYADDATTFYQNRQPLIGKEAIVAFLQADLHSNTNVISFKTNEVFPSSDGNQVVEIGYFKLVDSAKYVINTGNYMVLFEKRNGKYVCVRDMSTSDMPVE
jgi:ketosteroid isomerase-like protein